MSGHILGMLLVVESGAYMKEFEHDISNFSHYPLERLYGLNIESLS